MLYAPTADAKVSRLVVTKNMIKILRMERLYEN